MNAPRLSAAALLTLVLMACNNGVEDGQTTGQKVDAAITKIDDQADAAKAEMKRGVEEVKQSAGEAAQATAAAVADTAITASIKTHLAEDSELKATDIHVDTSAGRAALHGTAPNVAARDRATQLASAVNGVVAVDNQLIVKN